MKVFFIWIKYVLFQKYNVYVTGDPSLPIDQWHAFPVEGDLDEPKIVFQRGDLEPDTPYYVKVATVNDNGEGVQSDPTHFNTVSGGKDMFLVRFKKYI